MSDKERGAGDKVPIFLLKTRSIPHDGYEEQFERVKDELAFEPMFVPVLEHKFIEDGMDQARKLLQEKLIGKEEGMKYGGLIFTSQRAVEAFAKLVEEGRQCKSKPSIFSADTDSAASEVWPHLQDVPVYTVGPATSRALRSIPQNPPLQIFGEESGNGEALAHYMLGHYGRWYESKMIKPSLLFLVGDQRRDIIPKTLMDPKLSENRRIQVDELVVYGTGVMESFEIDFSKLLAETRGKDMRWVVVFSPTGCEAMLRALDMLDPKTGKARRAEQGRRKTFIATIGPTTRDFLRNEFGYEPDVCAEQPSPAGVEKGIRTFLEKL